MPTYSIAKNHLLESGLRDVLLQCNDCLEQFGAELHPALVTGMCCEIHPAALKVMTATHDEICVGCPSAFASTPIEDFYHQRCNMYLGRLQAYARVISRFGPDCLVGQWAQIEGEADVHALTSAREAIDTINSERVAV